MILKTATLHNYRQHKDLTVDFSGNLIAVCGANGSGKSNFLGAIQFALTGEQPGFNKEDLLSWGEETGYVELEFLHEGHQCKIQRRIEKPAVTLTVDGEKFSGAKKVAEALETHGIDKDVLRQSVFVRQTEVESCLFTDPRERELAFQRLIGLGDAAKHNKFLTDFLSAMEQPRDFTQEIETHKGQIAAQKEQLSALQCQLVQIEAQLAKPEYASFAETGAKRIEVLRERLSLLERAKLEWAELDTASTEEEKAVAEAGTAADATEADETALMTKVSSLTAELGVVRDARARREAANALVKDINELEGRLSGMEDPAPRIAEEKAMQERRVSVDAELAQLAKLLNNAPDGNVCPLCGSTTDHNIKEELSTRADALRREREDLSKVLDASTLVQELQQRKTMETELAAKKAGLLALGEVPEAGDAGIVSARLEAAKAEYASARNANAKLRDMRTRLDLAMTRKAHAQEMLDATLAKFPSRPKDKNQLDTVAQHIKNDMDTIFGALNALSEIKAEKAKLDGGISQLRLTMLTEQNALERVEELQEENRKKEAKVRVIEKVKDWFAYKNGPRVMTQAIMAMLVEETNKYLTQFGAAFTVVPMEEGMGFRCVFTDGRYTPDPPPEASMLSGGQKIALAVAFRFAVYAMFAGKLGLLSLDEPTAYLDDATIAHFGDILGRIKDLARNMGMQVLLATHETGILGNVDQTVTIGA